MANLQERLEALIAQAEQDTFILHNIVHQGADFTTTVESGIIPSLQKKLQDIRNEIIGGTNDIVALAETAKDLAVQAQNNAMLFRDETSGFKDSAQNSQEQAEYWAGQASAAASGLAENIHYNDTTVKAVLDSLGELAFLNKIALSQMQEEIINSLSQVGDEKLTLLSTAPENWLFEEGQEISRDEYSVLWAWVNDNNLVIPQADWDAGHKGLFSDGGGNLTFRLPDLRGQFIRIHDNGAGVDNDATSRVGGDTVGSVQLDDFKAHTHGITCIGGNKGYASAVRSDGFQKGNYTTASAGGTETRPKNMTRKMMIRYQ